MKFSRFLSDWDNLERNNLSLKVVVVILALALVVESGYVLRMVMDERIVLVGFSLGGHVALTESVVPWRGWADARVVELLRSMPTS